MNSATFALPESGRYEDGDFAVYPNSIIFDAGEYIDGQGRHFSMTPAELRQVCADFTPIAGNIWHKPFLAGRACEVRRIWTDDGLRMRGEVAVPLGLDKLLSADEKRLSGEFHPLDKRLIGIALTSQPVVEAAALMSRGNQEEKPMQEQEKDSLIAGLIRFITGNQPAQPVAAPVTTSGGFIQAEPLQFATLQQAEPKQPIAIEETPQFKALQAENERIKREQADASARAARTFAASALRSAVADADRIILESRALPEARPALIALFARSYSEAQGSIATFSLGDAPADEALLDTMPQGVTFSLDGAPATSSVELLRAVFAGVNPHEITKPSNIPSNTSVQLAGDRSAQKDATALERRRKLLASSEFGMQVLKKEEGK